VRAALRVLDPGALTLIEDLGRPGHAAAGVPTGGAADRPALRLGNRLVGNLDGAAGLETLLGGLTLRALTPVRMAVTGAPAPVTIDDRPVSFGAAVPVAAGATVRVGRPVVGLRTYVTVAGGVVAPTVYGSAAASPSLGVGPAPLRAGDDVAVGYAARSPGFALPLAIADPLEAGSTWAQAPPARVVLGPRADWFTPEAVRALIGTTWRASTDIDRIGVRLSGPLLTRAPERVGAELASEPMTRGAIQVPPDGIPIVLLADHPTTGGYPVIGVILDADTDRLAQLRPGDPVRFDLTASPFE